MDRTRKQSTVVSLIDSDLIATNALLMIELGARVVGMFGHLKVEMFVNKRYIWC